MKDHQHLKMLSIWQKSKKAACNTLRVTSKNEENFENAQVNFEIS